MDNMLAHRIVETESFQKIFTGNQIFYNLCKKRYLNKKNSNIKFGYIYL